jgi:hypothetical protein
MSDRRYIEWFVVARDPEHDNFPKEKIFRYWEGKEDEPGTAREKALKRQSWVKFQDKECRYNNVRVYAAEEAKLQRETEGGPWQWVFPEWLP